MTFRWSRGEISVTFVQPRWTNWATISRQGRTPCQRQQNCLGRRLNYLPRLPLSFQRYEERRDITLSHRQLKNEELEIQVWRIEKKWHGRLEDVVSYREKQHIKMQQLTWRPPFKAASTGLLDVQIFPTLIWRTTWYLQRNRWRAHYKKHNLAPR